MLSWRPRAIINPRGNLQAYYDNITRAGPHLKPCGECNFKAAIIVVELVITHLECAACNIIIIFKYHDAYTRCELRLYYYNTDVYL